MAQYAYTTVESVKQLLDAKSLTWNKDALLLKIIEGVSERINQMCERTFVIYEGTQTFSPTETDYLAIPDLLSPSLVAIDMNYDNIYEITLSGTTDYYMEPQNAPVQQKPYTRLRLRPRVFGGYYFPTHPLSTQITGKWGYWERLRSTGATVGESLSLSDTTITVATVTGIERGMTILIDSEQMYVYNIAGNDITVDRAVNGTTATTHAIATPIQRYIYPQAIEDATLHFCVRVYKRMETPLGMMNTPGDIGWRSVYIPKLDADIKGFIASYRRQGFV